MLMRLVCTRCGKRFIIESDSTNLPLYCTSCGLVFFRDFTSYQYLANSLHAFQRRSLGLKLESIKNIDTERLSTIAYDSDLYYEEQNEKMQRLFDDYWD